MNRRQFSALGTLVLSKLYFALPASAQSGLANEDAEASSSDAALGGRSKRSPTREGLIQHIEELRNQIAVFRTAVNDLIAVRPDLAALRTSALTNQLGNTITVLDNALVTLNQHGNDERAISETDELLKITLRSLTQHSETFISKLVQRPATAGDLELQIRRRLNYAVNEIRRIVNEEILELDGHGLACMVPRPHWNWPLR